MIFEDFERLVAIGFGVRLTKAQASSLVADLRSRLRDAPVNGWDAVEAADREDADALRTPKEPDAPA